VFTGRRQSYHNMEVEGIHVLSATLVNLNEFFDASNDGS
jgi:hypothetical protein